MELQTERNPEKRMNENDEIARINLSKMEILSSSNAGTWPKGYNIIIIRTMYKRDSELYIAN